MSHTADLAAALGRRPGTEVTAVGWSAMYPGWLYEGEVAGPDDRPDTPVPPGLRRSLRWWDPVSWWRTGSRLARDGADLLVLVLVVPFHAPALLALAAAYRAGRRRRGAQAHVLLLAHNVMPHEPHPGARLLVRLLLRRVGAVLVHSPAQADLAHALGAREVLVEDLPPHLPGGTPAARTAPRERGPGPLRLLFFGVVRDYKGVDVLLDAVREVPDVRLTVAGQLWGEAGRRVEAAAAQDDLGSRLEVRPGYVEPGDVAGLMASHDVMVLPYLHATASQNVELAHAYGMPVVASRVGTFVGKVRDGVDGHLVQPGSREDLARVLRALQAPGAVDALAGHVSPPDLRPAWDGYVRTVLSPLGAGA